LLGVSIVFGIRQKGINDKKEQYKGILQESLSQVDQAISLASVSPDRSRELFAEAQQKLTQIEGMDIKDPEIDTLRQKINDGKSSILGEYNDNPEMFLDLTLLSSGFKGDKIAFSNGQIYVMDSSGNRILNVGLATKKSKVIAGPGVINSPEGLAGYESKVFVLEGDGIYEVESGKEKVIDKSWSGEALISAFAGNMYVVDKSGNAIYRYQGQGSALGEKQNWLAAGASVNFADARQFAIDGAVYLLYPNSEIRKFSQGSPQSFRIRGVIPEIGSVDAIGAGPDNQYLYLLDRAGKRIVVTDKTGSYKFQYVNDQIGGATSLAVHEPDKKIILLTGDKLYSLEVKHL
jgi:sugar lactone lactonase YvrE